MTDVWERRLRRAEQLEKEWPFAAQILGFYQEVVRLQRGLYYRLLESNTHSPDGCDLDLLSPFVPKVIALIEASGGPGLVDALSGVRDRTQEEWTAYLLVCRSRADELLRVEDEEDRVSRFIARILLQPYLAGLREGGPQEKAGEAPADCPFCEVGPVASVLREDKHAETVRRTLLCPLCGFEWDFPRVLCPECREERPEKLPRYTAQEIPWVRIEACDSCKRYLKAVDLTKNPDAEPIVDELASTPLDVIARERGYAKLAPNLAGL